MATSHAIGVDESDYVWIRDRAAEQRTTRRNYLRRAIGVYHHVTSALVAMKAGDVKSIVTSVDGDRVEISVKRLGPVLEVRS